MVMNVDIGWQRLNEVAHMLPPFHRQSQERGSPLQSSQCMLFKGMEPEVPALDIELQIFVCAKCGREHSRELIHERYTAHAAQIAERKGGPPKGSV
jgi:hypothetical protein